VTCVLTDISARKQAEQERENLVRQLQEALNNIKTLRGLLAVCTGCQKIRHEKGHWEDFEACASRELYEETGVLARIEDPWWARVEPWRNPEDPELYAGVGFLARHQGGEIDPEAAAHDASQWVTETGWRSLRTWYTKRESDVLWSAIREMQR
jgi:hypothetical protein